MDLFIVSFLEEIIFELAKMSPAIINLGVTRLELLKTFN